MTSTKTIPQAKRGMAVFCERAMRRLAELRARKLELIDTLTDDESEELRWLEDYLQTRNGEGEPTPKGN